MTIRSHLAPGPPSPGMVEQLRHEHGRMGADLDRLSRALLQAPREDFPAVRARLEEWIAGVLVPHVRAEASLYGLVAAGPDGRALVESMEVEHRVLGEAADRFSSVWHPQTAAAWARSLSAAFDAHRSKEEELLFPRLPAA